MHAMPRGLVTLALALAACAGAPHADVSSSAAPIAPIGSGGAGASVALAPGEHRIRASDGAELYLKIAGHGPVCLLVHGGPGQGTLSTEKMGADRLERFLTLVYLDQRGSGKSPDAANYHLDRVTQDFEDVRRALGVERLCLIAHSFGGILAVEYARRYPQHVSRLVLANATLHFLSVENARMQVDFANRVLGREVATVPAGADAAAALRADDAARAAMNAAGLGYRFLSAGRAGIRVMGEIDGSYPRARGFGSAVMRSGLEGDPTYREYLADFAPVTASLRMPVLVITSRADYAVGPDEYRRFRFPDQTVAVLDGGHMSYYEQTDAFAAAIRTFMPTAAR